MPFSAMGLGSCCAAKSLTGFYPKKFDDPVNYKDFREELGYFLDSLEDKQSIIVAVLKDEEFKDYMDVYDTVFGEFGFVKLNPAQGSYGDYKLHTYVFIRRPYTGDCTIKAKKVLLKKEY